MDNHFNPSVSIEQFAAYLDGNLPENVMCQISSLIENDKALKSILDVSEQVDASLEDYASGGLQVPEELLTLDFELPGIHDTSVSLDMLPTDGGLMPDVAICAEEPHFMEDNNSNEHLDRDDSDINNQDYSNEGDSDDFSEFDQTQMSLDE